VDKDAAQYVGGAFSPVKVRISCQIPLLSKAKEKGRFDLQTVSFLASKNAPKIAEIQTSSMS